MKCRFSTADEANPRVCPNCGEPEGTIVGDCSQVRMVAQLQRYEEQKVKKKIKRNADGAERWVGIPWRGEK